MKHKRRGWCLFMSTDIMLKCVVYFPKNVV